MRSLGFLLLLACVAVAAPPGLELPKEAAGEPSAFIRVEAKTSGRNVRWVALDAGLNLFPIDLLRDSKTAVVTSSRPGRYRLLAVTAAGDEISEPAVCTVVVGEAPAPTPPGPKPPGPTPGPAPIPAEGFRVLIIEEQADRARLPAGQYQQLFSRTLRDYLDSVCVAGTSSGGTREWGIWDQNVTIDASMPKYWGQALESARKAPGFKTPWILISDGKQGYSGPLPADVNATVELVKRYKGVSSGRK